MSLTKTQKQLLAATEKILGKGESFAVPFPKRTPLQSAEYEIMRLSMNRPDLAPLHFFGRTRPLTDEEKAENTRRSARYKQERLDIIAKHEVEEELLNALRDKLDELLKQAAAIRNEIRELEDLATARRSKSKA